jgi:hypothetical protein
MVSGFQIRVYSKVEQEPYGNNAAVRALSFAMERELSGAPETTLEKMMNQNQNPNEKPGQQQQGGQPKPGQQQQGGQQKPGQQQQGGQQKHGQQQGGQQGGGQHDR